ncbi:MAG: toprim domain-containing protein, partial [Bacilli bacterium]|nr:toprim domain-containing protein [Bacilli bacterium]
RIGYAFKNGSESINYLKSKSYSLKQIENIGIAGLSGNNMHDKNAGRVIFPIMDYNGKVIGYSARRLDDSLDEAKYVNSPETPLFKKNEVLFNYYNAKEVARHAGYVYILEGFMDIFALRKAGIESCVALMGTAFTSNHVTMIRKLNVEVRLCLDGDGPGQTATMKICRILDKEGIPYRIVLTKNDERDPDEIVNESGIEALKDYLNNLVNKAEFALQYYLKTNKLQSLDDKKNLIKEFMDILTSTTDELELDNYILTLSKATGFTPDVIRKLVGKSKKANALKQNDIDIDKLMLQYHPEKRALKRLNLAEKEVLYQMLNDTQAIEYFENNIEYFVNDVYQTIADFVIEYYANENDINVQGIINLLSQYEEENAQKALNEVACISVEQTHPQYSSTLMDDCAKVIQKERDNTEHTKEKLLKSFEGKPYHEQIKLVDEFNKKRNKK